MNIFSFKNVLLHIAFGILSSCASSQNYDSLDPCDAQLKISPLASLEYSDSTYPVFLMSYQKRNSNKTLLSWQELKKRAYDFNQTASSATEEKYRLTIKSDTIEVEMRFRDTSFFTQSSHYAKRFCDAFDLPEEDCDSMYFYDYRQEIKDWLGFDFVGQPIEVKGELRHISALYTQFSFSQIIDLTVVKNGISIYSISDSTIQKHLRPNRYTNKRGLKPISLHLDPITSNLVVYIFGEVDLTEIKCGIPIQTASESYISRIDIPLNSKNTPHVVSINGFYLGCYGWLECEQINQEWRF